LNIEEFKAIAFGRLLLPHHLHEKSLPDWHVERVDDAY